MVGQSKWMDRLDADDGASRMARRSIRRRLQAVRQYLREIGGDRHPKPDLIHQLRVSTRRAMAALECYDDLTPNRRTAWVTKQLRLVRKAANDARDVDVFLSRVEKIVEENRPGEFQALAARLCELRREALPELVHAWRRLHRRDFDRKVRKLLDRIRWRDESVPEPSFAATAQTRLQGVVTEFFAHSEHAAEDIASLHQFRIAGKQLRYAMELFAGPLNPRVRGELYPLVADLQEHLGTLNDHATAAQRLEQWIAEWNDPTLTPTLSALLQEERAALDAIVTEFRGWWTAERAADWRRRFNELINSPSAERVA
ncbi:MAG: CHAD domain-containing protein [Planctomycetes bacterium]|nr:CHAD domain-containing protein [Planctomycetota bacterium]